MEGQTNQYSIQLLIDMKQSLSDMERAYAAFVKFKEPVVATVDVNMDLAKAEKEIADLTMELDLLKAQIAGLIALPERFGAEMVEAVNLVEKYLPGLSAALRDEAADMNAIGARIVEGMKKIPSDMKQEVKEAVGTILSLRGELKTIATEAEQTHAKVAGIIGRTEALNKHIAAGPRPAVSAPTAAAAASAVASNPGNIAAEIDAALAVHRFHLPIDTDSIVAQIRAALAEAAPMQFRTATEAVAAVGGPVNSASAAAVVARTTAMVERNAKEAAEQAAEEVAKEPRRRRTKAQIELEEAMLAARRATKGSVFNTESFLSVAGPSVSGHFDNIRAAFDKGADALKALGPAGISTMFSEAEKSFLAIRSVLKKEIEELTKGGQHLEAAQKQAALDYLNSAYRTNIIGAQRGLRERAANLAGRVAMGYDPTAISQGQGQAFARAWDAAHMQEAQNFNRFREWEQRVIRAQNSASQINDAMDAKTARGNLRLGARVDAYQERQRRDINKETASEWLARMRFDAQQEKAAEAERSRQVATSAALSKQRSKEYEAAHAAALKEEARRNFVPNEPRPTGLGTLFKNGLALFGGVNLAYTSYGAIRNAIREQEQYSQKIADIQGTLRSKNPFDAENLAVGISKVALKYGLGLNEAADAAANFAHAGLEAKDIVKQLDETMAAAKGIGFTIKQAQDLQLAVRAVTADNERFIQSFDYTAGVLDKVSRVESHYAVTAKDLASAMKTLSPIISEFSTGMGGLNDIFDYSNAITTVMVEKLRITGQQAANATKMIFARLTRPETLNKLQQHYGVRVGNTDTGDYLPVDQLINELGETYKRLDPEKRKAFATELSGGRNTHAAIALLEDYARVGEIATKSAESYGDASRRAAISTDTLLTQVGKLKTQFTLFSAATFTNSGLHAGLRDLTTGITSLLGGLTSLGGAGTLASVALGVTLFAGIRKLISAMKLFAGTTIATDTALARFGAGAITMFTPGGLIITGLVAAMAAWGAYSQYVKNTREELERYRVTARKIADVEQSPQYAVFKNSAESVGLIGKDASFADVKTGYQDVTKIIRNDKALAPLAKEMSELGEMTDEQLRKAFEKSPERFAKFQREFTKIFIQQLPEGVRKSFESLSTESERVNKVMDIVTSGTVTASYTMKSAIEDVHGAITRMMDDSNKALDEMLRKKNDPQWQDWFLNDGNLTKPIKPGMGYVVNRREGILHELDLGAKGNPLYEAILKNPDLRRRVGSFILDDKRVSEIFGGNPNGVTGQQIMTEAVQMLMGTNAWKEQLITAVTSRIGDPSALVNADSAFIAKQDPDLQRRIAAAHQQQSVLGEAEKRITDAIKKGNPDLVKAGAMANILQRGGSAVTKGNVGAVSGTSVGTALDSFTDLLIKSAREVYEAVHSFTREAKDANDFHLAYDRGAALVRLGNSLQNKQDDERVEYLFKIVELDRREKNLTEHATGKDSGDAISRETASISAERENLRNQLLQYGNSDFGNIFGFSDEGIELKQKFMQALTEAGAGNYDNLDKLMKDFPDAAKRLGYSISATNKKELQDLDLIGLRRQKNNELQQAQIPVNATIQQGIMQRAKAALDEYNQEKAKLDLLEKQGGISGDDLKLARAKLDAEYQINAAYAARLDMATAQNALDQQTLTNITSMMSGVKRLVTDSSIWEDIVSPKGLTKSARWKQSAEAIRDLLFQTITPVFKTISDRVMENVFDSVTDALMNIGKIKDIAGFGESRLQENLAISTAFETGGLSAGQSIATQMQQAGLAVATMIATAMGNPAPVGDEIVGLPGGNIEGAAAVSKMSTARRNALIAGAGLALGSVGGTLVGKGGKYAQAGSSIGSTAGMLIGTSIGGPIGGAIGATVLGVLGGFLGGKKDDHSQEYQPIVKGLEAIERAQKETITTIQAQTDALLNPTNRFLNLPSGLNFNPAGAGFFGAGGRPININVNVPVTTNASPAEIEDAVANAVGKVLNEARSTTSWG